jgi:hypothetical protein
MRGNQPPRLGVNAAWGVGIIATGEEENRSAMKGFDTSSLWRVSAFRKARREGDLDVGPAADRATLLPTTLLADLRRLQSDGANGDVLEVIAACLRNHEAALLYLELGAYVWPVTLLPREGLYHSPRDALSEGSAMSGLRLLSIEPPGVRAPGDLMHERVARADRYRPLPGLLWAVAVNGPRPTLLTEISGRVACRVVPSNKRELPPTRGAISSAILRLEREAAPLRDIARWPGMSVERANRLLNALYLNGALLVSRSHPAARRHPVDWRGLLGRRR